MGHHSQSFKDSQWKKSNIGSVPWGAQQGHQQHQVHSKGTIQAEAAKGSSPGLTDDYPGNGKELTAVKVEKELKEHESRSSTV